MTTKKFTGWYRRKSVWIASVVAVLVGAHLMLSWPHNYLGKVVYRALGRQMPPRRSEELVLIRQFLKAKRLLDNKDYAMARAELEHLKARVNSKFLFYRETYLYLGYIYDVQGDFGKEEALYGELKDNDEVLYKFLFGLYYHRHGQEPVARRYLRDALVLDNKYHRLNTALRDMLHKTIGHLSDTGKSVVSPPTGKSDGGPVQGNRNGPNKITQDQAGTGR